MRAWKSSPLALLFPDEDPEARKLALDGMDVSDGLAGQVGAREVTLVEEEEEGMWAFRSWEKFSESSGRGRLETVFWFLVLHFWTRRTTCHLYPFCFSCIYELYTIYIQYSVNLGYNEVVNPPTYVLISLHGKFSLNTRPYFWAKFRKLNPSKKKFRLQTKVFVINQIHYDQGLLYVCHRLSTQHESRIQLFPFSQPSSFPAFPHSSTFSTPCPSFSSLLILSSNKKHR